MKYQQRVFRLEIDGANLDRLNEAAHRREVMPAYLLEKLINLILHERLIDAVMDDGAGPTANSGTACVG